MSKWQLWVNTKEAWDKALLLSADNSVFQTFSWGEYKKLVGWRPERYFIMDNGNKIQGMAQVLIKHLPFGFTFIWVSGGLVFKFPDFKMDELAGLVHKLILKLHKQYPRSLVRFNSHVNADPMLSLQFNKVCSRPYAQLNSGFTVELNLNKSIDQLRKGMASKHRYYTKRAVEVELTWVVANDDHQLTILESIYQEMVKEKKLLRNFFLLDELFNMRENMGENLIILTGFFGEVPVTSCLVLVFGKKAFYMTASTNKLGRDISAGYAMFEQLMRVLGERGVTEFDFGGVNLNKKSATGVNHFKIGFGGKVVEYLGEWESASSKIVKLAINLAIRLKVGRR